jgi:zinc protease
MTAKPGEAEALDLLLKITGDGSTSRIYKKLVVESQLASSAGGGYEGSGLDSAKIGLYAVAAEGVSLDKIEKAIDDVLDDVAKNGVTAAELERAKNSYLAEYIYENDNQANLARRYGWSLAVGRSIAQIEAWPADIAKVSLDDIKAAAVQYLDIRRSVTGILLPDAPAASADGNAPAPAKNRT